MNEWIANNPIAGWVFAGVMVVIAAIKYGATWIQAWGETGNVHMATLMTTMLKRIDHLTAEIEHKEEVIKSLVEQQRDCQQESATLRRQVEALEHQIKTLNEAIGSISGEHERP